LSTRPPEDRFRIFETRQFQKDLRQIAKAGHAEIANRLREIVYPQLRQSPHFGANVRKLKGYSPETWRYRIGAWRFFYEIDEAEAVVLMIAASHRGSAY
jgi:mRNA interferase RelE/StbE